MYEVDPGCMDGCCRSTSVYHNMLCDVVEMLCHMLHDVAGMVWMLCYMLHDAEMMCCMNVAGMLWIFCQYVA